MAIKLGSTDIVDIKLGDKQVSAVYLGDKLVWEKVAAVDPDAVAFISAAGLTDANDKAAANYLISELKKNSLWAKFNQIYPFIGSSNASHSVNAKYPSLEAGQAGGKLKFNGGITSTSLQGSYAPGGLGSGNITQYCVKGTTSTCIVYYNSVSTGNNQSMLGGQFGVNVNGGFWANFEYATSKAATAQEGLGTVIANIDTAHTNIFANGIKKVEQFKTRTGTGANNSFQLEGHPNKFFALGDTILSDSESVAMCNIVNELQRMLNRQV